MNPLTREALLTLVDEASDEQIISAIEDPTTSVLLFRFLLKQYLIDLTSVPGNKLNHKETISDWSQILGYVELEQQRKRATISTAADELTADDNDDDTDSSAAASQMQQAFDRSKSHDDQPQFDRTKITIDCFDAAPRARAMTNPIALTNVYKPASPFGISPISSIRSSNVNNSGAFNLFRKQQETIAEETEEDEFDESKELKYDQIKQRPITPPIISLEEESSSSGVESETPDFEKDIGSVDGNTPHRATFRPNRKHTLKSIMNHDHIDVRLLNMEKTMSKQYDLSDDDEILVELDTNLELGNFRATLFMRVWLNITAFLEQKDKLLSLQLVSKKFRAIAMAANHWQNIEINLNQIQDEMSKLQRFLDMIQHNIQKVTICNVSADASYEINAILECIPSHIKALIIKPEERILPRFDFTTFIDLQELIICGSMDCNENDLCDSLRDMQQVRVMCFDLNDVQNENDRNEICNVLPNELEEFWIPHSVNTKWFELCLKAQKLSKLKVLESFPKYMDHMDKTQIALMYEHNCFECEILELIAQHCVEIEYISIDCKLQKEFGDTLKYLLSKCHNLHYVALKLNIAHLVMDEDGGKQGFLTRLAELKINCLQILQELSTNYKYQYCTSFAFYTKHKREMIIKQNDSEYDLEFTLFKQ